MGLIRISRGVPRFNIQIGPIKDALAFNPSLILSVTDYFEWKVAQFPHFHWIPINESGQSWGYKPFFAVKRILDFHCLHLQAPLVYLGCSAGIHRSPMSAFCWLLSLDGATIDSVLAEFYGEFRDNLAHIYRNDIKAGYIPPNLPEFYKLMKDNPGDAYHQILNGMLKEERVTYV